MALDPYTSHGHDGVMTGDEIVSDMTSSNWCLQALPRRKPTGAS